MTMVSSSGNESCVKQANAEFATIDLSHENNITLQKISRDNPALHDLFQNQMVVFLQFQYQVIYPGLIV